MVARTCEYDVVIVGAGLIGSTLACALADSGLTMLVVDAKPPQQLEDDSDLRVSAISLASERILHAVNCWHSVVSQRACPFRRMYVWDACGRGKIEFDCADIGTTHLGHIVENNLILDALLQRMVASPNVDLWRPAEVVDIVHASQSVDLIVSMNVQRGVRARLLVGADGVDSQVRKAAGLEVAGWRYKQRAIVATVTTEAHHRETAWQRFLPTGPLAFLPLSDGRSSIVWSCDEARAAELLVLDDAEFKTALESAFDYRLGAIHRVSKRLSFPLKLVHARSYIGMRTALVGDAAHSLHPLAGQGANLGLIDAASLAEVVLDANAVGADIAVRSALRRYERWRKGDNLVMMLALDGLKRLFGNDHPLVARARNLGISLADISGPVKHHLMRRATGLAGDLPRLARTLL